MDLRDASVQCCLQGFQRQRLCQLLTEFPPSDHAGEDIHEEREIDEVSLESDVSNIAHPDLIASIDLKGLQVIDPRTHTVSGVSHLRRAFDCDTGVLEPLYISACNVSCLQQRRT